MRFRTLLLPALVVATALFVFNAATSHFAGASPPDVDAVSQASTHAAPAPVDVSRASHPQLLLVASVAPLLLVASPAVFAEPMRFAYLERDHRRPLTMLALTDLHALPSSAGDGVIAAIRLARAFPTRLNC